MFWDFERKFTHYKVIFRQYTSPYTWAITLVYYCLFVMFCMLLYLANGCVVDSVYMENSVIEKTRRQKNICAYVAATVIHFCKTEEVA